MQHTTLDTNTHVIVNQVCIECGQDRGVLTGTVLPAGDTVYDMNVYCTALDGLKEHLPSDVADALPELLAAMTDPEDISAVFDTFEMLDNLAETGNIF